MDVEHRENGWLVSLSWEERAEIYAAGRHPSERAVAVVADRAAIDIDDLHSAVVRTNDDGMEVVVRRRR